MLKIRLFRVGRNKQPFYKIVVIDKDRAPRGGRFIEELGFLDPKSKELKLDGERAKHWISKGAQPSDTIHNLLVKVGVIKEAKRDVHKKSKKSADVKNSGETKEAPKEEPKKEEVDK